MRLFTVIALAFSSVLTIGFGQQEESPLAEPDGAGINAVLDGQKGFREVGKYRVNSSTLLRLGKATELEKGEMVFRVFSDGVDVRLSPDGDDESFISFQIYRNDGVFDETGENLLPGLFAFSDQGGVIRHLVVEPRMMTLTKFPISSSNQEIIYAIRDTQ
jgi:hypothetical protein